jgi:hypothetical protein
MKKISCYLFLTVLLCISCVKEEDVQDPVAPVTQTETPTGVTLPSGVILPKSMIKTFPNGISSVTNYRYIADNKISSIVDGNQEFYFGYTNDLITEIRFPNRTTPTKYSYDAMGRLMELTYKYDMSASEYKTTFTYNPDETILEERFQDNNLASSASFLYTYSKGNLIKDVSPYNVNPKVRSIRTYNYEYDSSNTPIKNIVGYKKLNLDRLSGANNPTKLTYVLTSVEIETGIVLPTETTIYTWEYVYDVTKSYPVEVKEFKDKVLQSTTKINY